MYQWLTLKQLVQICVSYMILDHFGSSAMPRAIISGGSSVDPSSLKKKKLYHTQHNKNNNDSKNKKA
jgi:hypothetical protein